jgi:aminopeptidase N
MTEEIQEIERLIKQSAELAESLIRLAQKLREQHQRLLHEIDNEQSSPHHEAYAAVRRMVASGTITAQEAAVKLLQVAAIHGTMTPADAAEQVAKLLRPDLPVSRRIELREIAKAAFEADDDVLVNIKPFLKGTVQNQQPRQQQIGKTVAVTP